ncbi:hypothetical protein CB1_001749016 [Camelus ferus]|nr:hypothetical protein CB1_001749016 [Camelus ferus]
MSGTNSPEAVKKLLENMQSDLRALSLECKKKFPPVKEDLCQLVNADAPYWLVGMTEMTRTFGLELLESVLNDFPQVFLQCLVRLHQPAARCLEMLDKVEPPTIPEGYAMSVAFHCLLDLVRGITTYSIQGQSVTMISPSSESHQQVVAVGQPLAVQPQGTVMDPKLSA